MTTGQLGLMTGFYLAAFVFAAYFTRAKLQRIIGSLAGGVVFGFVALGGVAFEKSQSWWRVPQAGVSHFYFMLWLGFAVSCPPVSLVLWRIVRRFGGRGLLVCILISMIIGPPRDYAVAAMFPAWMTFAPGL